MNETFQPIAVKPPSSQPWIFFLRRLVDLQLSTIYTFLVSVVSTLQGRVLDVGAGESPWRELLPKNAEYFGIDIDSACQFGMSQQENMFYYDGTKLPFGEHSFSGVLCIEVLEHVDKPFDFMAEIYRVLQPNGKLVLTIPWSARRHHIPYDFQRYTREGLTLLLTQCGFEEIEVRERGNDIGVIANKLWLLSIRLLKPKRWFSIAFSLPIAVFCFSLAVAFTVAFHISLKFKLGSPEDPLGYAVTAIRGRMSTTHNVDSIFR